MCIPRPDGIKASGHSLPSPLGPAGDPAGLSEYDLLLCMDNQNVRNLLRLLGGDPEGKVRKLLEYAGQAGDVADPWYTGGFDRAYEDIYRGCAGLMKALGYPEFSNRQ